MNSSTTPLSLSDDEPIFLAVCNQLDRSNDFSSVFLTSTPVNFQVDTRIDAMGVPVLNNVAEKRLDKPSEEPSQPCFALYHPQLHALNAGLASEQAAVFQQKPALVPYNSSSSSEDEEGSLQGSLRPSRRHAASTRFALHQFEGETVNAAGEQQSGLKRKRAVSDDSSSSGEDEAALQDSLRPHRRHAASTLFTVHQPQRQLLNAARVAERVARVAEQISAPPGATVHHHHHHHYKSLGAHAGNTLSQSYPAGTAVHVHQHYYGDDPPPVM